MKDIIQRFSMISRRTGVIIGISVLVLILIIIAVISMITAQSSAQAYHNQYSDWSKNEKNKLLRSNEDLIAKVYATGEDNGIRLEKMSKACNEVGERRKAVQDIEYPKLQPNVFGFVSSKYNEEKKLSDKRNKEIGQYTIKAVETLQQLQANCEWLSEGRSMQGELDKATQDANNALQKFNERIGTTYCDNPGGCTPSDSDRRAAYIDARERFTKLSLKTVDMSKKNCKNTSLKEAGCQQALSDLREVNEKQLERIQILRSGTDAATTIRASEVSQAGYKTYYDKTRKLFSQRYPYISDKADFEANPSMFGMLKAIDRYENSQLVKAQQAIKNL